VRTRLTDHDEKSCRGRPDGGEPGESTGPGSRAQIRWAQNRHEFAVDREERSRGTPGQSGEWSTPEHEIRFPIAVRTLDSDHATGNTPDPNFLFVDQQEV